MSQASLYRAIQTSRPRFWIYVLGPYLLGIAGAIKQDVYPSQTTILFLILLFIYFTFPANFLLYGINDIHDYETDKLNAKKQGYEQAIRPSDQRSLLIGILITNLPFLLIAPFLDMRTIALFALFLFLSIYYSSPPLRFKTKPIIDSISNILYLIPGLISYSIIAIAIPAPQIILAGTFWCMAMHAYSAVPDIEADRRANLPTIATLFGKQITLLFCAALYILSAILIFTSVPLISIVFGGCYLILIGLSLIQKTSQDLLSIYRFFPFVNTLAGAILFFTILL